MFFVQHWQLRAIDSHWQNRTDKSWESGTSHSNWNKARKHLVTAHSLPGWERGHQLYVAATRTRVATLAQTKNFKSSGKRSNSSTGHFDRGWFSSWLRPYPSWRLWQCIPPREAGALVSLPRAALAAEDTSSDCGARQSVRVSSQLWQRWLTGLQGCRMALREPVKTGTGSGDTAARRRCTGDAPRGCSHTSSPCTPGYRAQLPAFSQPGPLPLPALKCEAWQTPSVWLQAQLRHHRHFLATGRFLTALPPLQKTQHVNENHAFNTSPCLTTGIFQGK